MISDGKGGMSCWTFTTVFHQFHAIKLQFFILSGNVLIWFDWNVIFSSVCRSRRKQTTWCLCHLPWAVACRCLWISRSAQEYWQGKPGTLCTVAENTFSAWIYKYGMVRYWKCGAGYWFTIYIPLFHVQYLNPKLVLQDEQRARDLFYALWIPDLFMKRVEENGEWSLMCPHESPGLHDTWGREFYNCNMLLTCLCKSRWGLLVWLSYTCYNSNLLLSLTYE